jgi:hypothetical protein
MYNNRKRQLNFDLSLRLYGLAIVYPLLCKTYSGRFARQASYRTPAQPEMALDALAENAKPPDGQTVLRDEFKSKT